MSLTFCFKKCILHRIGKLLLNIITNLEIIQGVRWDFHKSLIVV